MDRKEILMLLWMVILVIADVIILFQITAPSGGLVWFMPANLFIFTLFFVLAIVLSGVFSYLFIRK